MKLTKEKFSITFLVLDGFSNMVLASAIEPLRVANSLTNTRDIAWQIVSLEGGSVFSSSGLQLVSDISLDELTHSDLLLVVGGYGVRSQVGSVCASKVIRAVSRVGYVGALDSGAWLLGFAGLLDGYKATIHWSQLADFAEEYTLIDVRREKYVIDRARITAGGAASVMHLMLHLLQYIFDSSVVFDVVSMFLHDVEDVSTEGVETFSSMFSMGSLRLKRAIHLMRESIEDPLSIPEIARALTLSTKTLERCFFSELGVSPVRYYLSIRLHHARELIEETDMVISDIAVRSGFSSISSFSRAYRKYFGVSASSMRVRRFD